MGEAKMRADEIDAIKVKEAEQAQQARLMAHFTEGDATYINGVFLIGVGSPPSMVRFSLHETLSPTASNRVRFSGVTDIDTLGSIGEAFVKMRDQMRAGMEQAAKQGMEAAAVAGVAKAKGVTVEELEALLKEDDRPVLVMADGSVIDAPCDVEPAAA